MAVEPALVDPDPEEDPESFERLYRALYGDVVNYVRWRMLPAARRWADPEDVAQRVLMELREKLDAFERPFDLGYLRAWLCRRADWRLANLCRDQGRMRGETAFPHGGDVGPRQDLTDGTVTRSDTRRYVRELVERLPWKYALVVRKCALEGLTFAAAARELGLSEDAVRKRYARAREVLAELLGRRRRG